MRVRDFALELDDPCGLLGAVRDPGESQHRGDVLLVLGADRGHRRGGVDVVAPVGQAEATLEQERGVLGWIVEVLGDPEAEQVLGVEVGVVERVDVGPEG
jgi:hypothetical protein